MAEFVKIVEHHLCFDYMFQDRALALEVLKRIGLHRAKRPSNLSVRLALVEQCLAPYVDINDWIQFSLNESRYIGMQRYNGPDFKREQIAEEIRKLAKYGLIELVLAEPMSHKNPEPRQSRYRATPKLCKMMEGLSLTPIIHEVIYLNGLFDRITGKPCSKKIPGRKFDKKLIGYKDTDETVACRKQIWEINTFLSEVKLHWKELADLNVCKKQSFDKDGLLTSPLYIYRTFSRGNLSLCGRFQGFWLNKPKALRSKIKLNGEETCEPDYSSLHCAIAYLEAGLEPPKDAYDIEGWSRESVKRAFAILLNAMDLESAVGAVKCKLKLDELEAFSLIEDVKLKHKLIRDQLHNDKGIEFMKIDSDIALSVMLKLTEEEIPFLPIHDSFRVPVSVKDRTIEIMKTSFKERYSDYDVEVKS